MMKQVRREIDGMGRVGARVAKSAECLFWDERGVEWTMGDLEADPNSQVRFRGRGQ